MNLSELNFKTRFTAPGILSLAAVISCYLFLTISQASSAYVIDEAAFPFAANGVLSHGFPVFYNGETRPQDIGLWHPPLYIYTLAGHIALFGFNPLSVRFYGIVAVLLSLAVLFVALKVLSPRTSQLSVVVLAAIFLLNPLVISGALVPDIDGTIGIFSFSLVSLLAVLFLRLKINFKLWIFASIVMLILISTKFTIAILGILILLVAAIFSDKYKFKKLLAAFSATAVGLISFLGLYGLLALIPGFVYSGPFDYFFGSLSQRKSVSNEIVSLIFDRLFIGPGSVIYWLTPGLFIAAIASFIFLMSSREMSQKRASLLLAAALFIVVVAYAVITSSPFGFPKYWGIALVPASLLIALSFSQITNWKFNYSVARWIGILIVVVLSILGTANAYIAISKNTVETGRSIPLVLIFTSLFSVLFFICFLVLFNFRQKGATIKRIGFLLVGALTLSSISLSAVIDFVNARAQYSTRYYFSEVGMNNLVSFLQNEIPKEELILVAKDAGIQSNHRFIEDAQWLFLSPHDLEQALLNSDVTYWISRKKWDYSEPSFPDQFEILKKYFVPIAQQPSPDFVVWKRL